MNAAETAPETAPILSPTPDIFSVLIRPPKETFLVGEVAKLEGPAEVEWEIAGWGCSSTCLVCLDLDCEKFGGGGRGGGLCDYLRG